MHIAQIQNNLARAIESALKKISSKIQGSSGTQQSRTSITFNYGSPTSIELESPKDPKRGDLTTNAAMRFAKNFSLASENLASLIKDELSAGLAAHKLDRFIQKIDVLPPGFINFWFGKEYLYSLLSEIDIEKESFGSEKLGKGESINIEFVSANPTGPLTVAHGRQAAVGDAIARILEFSGYKVSREYLINDVGNQITLLGKSIYARYLALNGENSEFPGDGYQGEYIKKIAEEINKKYGKKYLEASPKNLKFFSEFGVNSIMRTIKVDLDLFGVRFDRWFSQKDLSAAKIKQVLNGLKSKGYVFEKDGAVWFKATAFGDEKDRVVIKQDGAFTYLAPDILYHLDKYKRRFNRLIDIWGPDHHGYIPRLKAAVEALGYERDTLSVLIVQLATLLRNGEVLSMSTRKGEFITLREVINEVGCDVAKFFFLMRKLDSHLDFDLELAKKNSLENPVYYIQYAHARISSILGFSRKLESQLKKVECDPGLLNQEEEIGLLRLCSQFPLIIEASAKMLEPYKLIEFLNELAKAFHSFYTKHRVVQEGDLVLTKARLKLVEAVKIVLARGLSLLGISFPERM